MSKSIHLEEIPYLADSCELFDRIRDLPRAALLDSSFPHTSAGRYDILTAQPWRTDVPRLIPGADETQCQAFFSELNHFHHEHYQVIQPVSSDIPFCGGLIVLQPSHLRHDTTERGGKQGEKSNVANLRL